MGKYLALLRVKHYIKNILIFLPLVFGGLAFDSGRLVKAGCGFLAFSFVASAIYIFNDLKDMGADKKHPKKKLRPLASGLIHPAAGVEIMVALLGMALIISVSLADIKAGMCLLAYLLLNIAYSLGLKNQPIIDVVLLASGFVIRTFYGGFIAGVEISQWLYLVVTTGSLYMGLGKRRNELKKQTDTRKVLAQYNIPFLDKNMYVCLTLTIVFYSLWTLDFPDTRMIWSVPAFITMLLFYSLSTEKDSDGDPVEVILSDRGLIAIIIGYAIYIFCSLYIWRF